MKKVVITGGYGFVGTRLVERLVSSGLDVVILEHPDTVPPAGLEHLTVVRADISSAESMARATCPGVDAVLHLAAQSSGPRSFSIPLQDVQLNIVGTLNTINWCLANDVGRMLFASSFVVYGDHPDREALDEQACCRPKSVYATSKLACEHLLMNYAQPKGIRWNALRMFNVYGPGQDVTRPDQGVVGIFMKMLMDSDRVTVKGSLDRFRDLIFIDDVLQGWERCLRSTAYNRAFNLGTGDKTRFERLIRSIATVMGKAERLRIDEQEGTPGDMMGCVADLTQSRSMLGYAPEVALEDGLRKMWNWVQASRTA